MLLQDRIEFVSVRSTDGLEVFVKRRDRSFMFFEERFDFRAVIVGHRNLLNYPAFA
jgi:hypothetical protein